MVAERQRFFIIGAQRSGTTLLHECLDRHPDVAMHAPVRPEPKHFLTPGSEQVEVDEYDRRYFVDLDAPVRGEKGTTYLERPEAGARILTRFPDARFIVIVRDPVERAISNWRFSRRHGVEMLSAAAALTVEAEARPYDADRFSTSPYRYLQRGHYAAQLDAWADVVGADRLAVVRLAEVVDGDALGTLQRFLGLDVHPDVVVRGHVNANEDDDADDLADVRVALAEHFREPNRELARRWGIAFDTAST